MSHLTQHHWHGYETEPRRVELTIASDLAAGNITAAELRIAGQPAVELTPGVDVDGYTLIADPVVLPDRAGVYRWAAEVTDDQGNTPVVVAVGSLRVDDRVDVEVTSS